MAGEEEDTDGAEAWQGTCGWTDCGYVGPTSKRSVDGDHQRYVSAWLHRGSTQAHEGRVLEVREFI